MDAAASDVHTFIYDDFAEAGGWPGDKWYRHLPMPGLWDPAAVGTCTGGADGTLALEARRFTLTRERCIWGRTVEAPSAFPRASVECLVLNQPLAWSLSIHTHLHSHCGTKVR